MDWEQGPVGLKPRPVAAPVIRQRRLWTLQKDVRRAECLVRQHPLGPEVRVNLNGELLWSQVTRSRRELDAIAAEHLDAFVARGWEQIEPEH